MVAGIGVFITAGGTTGRRVCGGMMAGGRGMGGTGDVVGAGSGGMICVWLMAVVGGVILTRQSRVEDGVALLIFHPDVVFIEVGGAVGVAEFADANKIVREPRHNVASACEVCWDGWDCELNGSD
jgi:hypothetical protein